MSKAGTQCPARLYLQGELHQFNNLCIFSQFRGLMHLTVLVRVKCETFKNPPLHKSKQPAQSRPALSARFDIFTLRSFSYHNIFFAERVCMNNGTPLVCIPPLECLSEFYYYYYFFSERGCGNDKG